jgi:hypothetical protein
MKEKLNLTFKRKEKKMKVSAEQCEFLSHELNSVPCDRCGNTDESISLTHNGSGRITRNVHIDCKCGRLTGYGRLKKTVLSELRKIRK